MLGVSITATNLPQIVARIGQVPIKVKTQASLALSKAGVDGGNILRGLLRQSQSRDPFWGVTGTKAPVGLGVRTGNTFKQVIATGRVYNDMAGGIWTFIAHPGQHIKQLEDGGVVKGNPWLKIPTRAAQTPSGADRWPSGKAPNSFIWPTKKMVNFKGGRPKRPWIVTAAGGKLTLLYMLTTSVTLRPHHTFATLNRAMGERMLELGRGAMAAIVREA